MNLSDSVDVILSDLRGRYACVRENKQLHDHISGLLSLGLFGLHDGEQMLSKQERRETHRVHTHRGLEVLSIASTPAKASSHRFGDIAGVVRQQPLAQVILGPGEGTQAGDEDAGETNSPGSNPPGIKDTRAKEKASFQHKDCSYSKYKTAWQP